VSRGWKQALGQFILSKSTVSELTERLSQEYEAFRPRALSGSEGAYLFMEAGYEPLRRWGSKRGVLCGWALGLEGGKVRLSLSTAHSESYESCREVLRDLIKRGLQTPVTITTEGAAGLSKAVEAMGPQSLRLRCWVHKRQHGQQQVPPQAWPECNAVVVERRDAPTVGAADPRRQALVPRSQRDFARSRSVSARRCPGKSQSPLRPSAPSAVCPHLDPGGTGVGGGAAAHQGHSPLVGGGECRQAGLCRLDPGE
jgi:transposase-like protein